MANKSRFFPKNPQKYAGDVHNIICRSNWEFALCNFLDTNSAVASWTSEEIVIPYISPMDEVPTTRHYYVDFGIEFTNGKQILVEVKPHYQTLMPAIPKRKTARAVKTYQDALKTYAINQAKWRTATQVARSRGAEFHVFTEHELRKLGIRI